MPKSCSTTALALINQPTGTEPFIVLQVNWNGEFTYYTTRAIAGANNNIIDVSNVTNQRRSDSFCNVGSVRVTFSDTDGAMKRIIDTIVAENCPAAVYLAFMHTTENDWISLINGRIVGPITWNEVERTLSLGIETYVNSHEVGYAAQFADFKDLNPNSAGVPWPMIFGKCAHVPSLLVRRHATANLQCALQFYMNPPFALVNNNQDIIMRGDPTTRCFLDNTFVNNVLYVDDAHEFPQNKVISIIVEDIVFTGQFVDNTKFEIIESNVPKFKNVAIGPRQNDADHDNAWVLWITDATITLANHHCYFRAPGKEVYNYCVKQIGTKCWFRSMFREPASLFASRLMDVSDQILEVYGISKCGLKDAVASDVNFMKDAIAFRRKTAGANNFGALMARFDAFKNNNSAWWQCPMDSQVRIWGITDPDIYIASLAPLTTVKAVWGKRRVTVNNKSRTIFSQIPTSYYIVNHATYKIVGQTAVGIIFNKPLSDYPDQQWTDDVFVTAQSAIGPNAADIIQWILTNFTDLKPDPTSFAIARSHVASHPANFALFDKRDALKLVQDIAYQAKCALLLDQGAVGIIYLPVQPAQEATFNEDSVKNLHLDFTERREIHTKFVASYSTTYKDKHHLAHASEFNIRRFERTLRSLIPTNIRIRSETQMYVYTNNITRFGLRTKEEAAWIYNDYAAVKSFANFWGFRASNCWRKLTFETFLQGIRLQVFDGVAVSFVDQTLINTTLVMGIVDSVSYDPKTYTTKIEVWLPIVAGGVFMEANFWPDSNSGSNTGYWNVNTQGGGS